MRTEHRLEGDNSAECCEDSPHPLISRVAEIARAESVDPSFEGQNMLHDRPMEFNDTLQSANSSQIKRTTYVKLV
jgi:hypothetical protein